MTKDFLVTTGTRKQLQLLQVTQNLQWQKLLRDELRKQISGKELA